MNQHEFVVRCLERYECLGIILGDPNEGKWNKAHYPAPNPEGDTTIPMLFDDHQQQGLYQSEEWGRCCFFSSDTKRFLTHGPFVPNWFDLWDLYDKWVGDNARKHNKKLHSEKDEFGRSIVAVQSANKLHEEKDEFGRSIHMLKLHEEKDELGRSVRGVKNAKRLHEEKNEIGKSVNAVKGGTKGAEKLHSKKDEFGRSIVAVRSIEKVNLIRFQCLKTGHISTPGGLSRYQNARGIDVSLRKEVT